ncbi:MAG: hypothetical protein Q8Q01_02730 [archaeon]|nr:hypothetical protein [archaeon]
MAKRKSSRSRTKKKVEKKTWFLSGWKPAPLPSSFMLTSILGLIFTMYIIIPLSADFAIAFLIIFSAMFVASLISMTKAPLVEFKK